MQAIFMARGPSFNERVEIDSLKNVDIYHIACHILGLNPNPNANAGSLANLTSIFRSTESSSTTRITTANSSKKSSSPLKRLKLLLLTLLFVSLKF